MFTDVRTSHKILARQRGRVMAGYAKQESRLEGNRPNCKQGSSLPICNRCNVYFLLRDCIFPVFYEEHVFVLGKRSILFGSLLKK